MKVNQWTAGLLAVGAVSLASVAQADEKSGMVGSVSSTALSGYVDTSMQWNLGTGNTHAPLYKYGGPGKADSFNLDAVKLTLNKDVDESDWATGYRVDLLMGPDAVTLGTLTPASGFAIEQAYVALRAPVGNGLDFRVGVFDSIVGYESTDSVNNPNFTRSWGHTFEPSTHTGVLAKYQVNKMVAVSAGVANTLSPPINGRANPPAAESYKTYMAAVSLTAPDNWRSIGGSSLYGGVVNGFNTLANVPEQFFYAGATLNTPVTGLRVGASWDYAQTIPVAYGPGSPPPFGLPALTTALRPGIAAHSFAAYASYQFKNMEKLSVHARAEYANLSATAADLAQAAGAGIPSSVMSFTGTLQYDLWKNVLSRLEFRWDHALDGTKAFGGTTTRPGAAFVPDGGHIFTGTLGNSFILAANVVYKF